MTQRNDSLLAGLPCPCRNCSTPENTALRQQMIAQATAEKAINRAAFDLYCADKDTGRELQPVAFYRAKASEQLAPVKA
jgi:hypothetical protein